MPSWYALAQHAKQLGMRPWELEEALETNPHAAWWLRRLQAAWALEADDTINRMRDG